MVFRCVLLVACRVSCVVCRVLRACVLPLMRLLRSSCAAVLVSVQRGGHHADHPAVASSQRLRAFVSPKKQRHGTFSL
jgi:hypothetical protein